MNKKQFFLKQFVAWTILFLSFSAFAFAKPVVFPEWYTDEGLEETYPSSIYIRERGEGRTKADAENDAVSYIARYFETEASVNSAYKLEGVSENDSVKLRETTTIENTITSNIKLFGIKYSEPFYLKKQKTYYIVAYIDIKDAWERYEPEIRSERNTFIAFYNEAQSESDPIKKIKLYNAAYEAGRTFDEKLSFAYALSKRNTEKTFGSDIQILSSLPATIRKEQLANAVFILVDNDVLGIVENAVRYSLTEAGFALTKTRSQAAYTARVSVNYNAGTSGSRVVMNPELQLSLDGKNGSVYTFGTQTERVVAPSQEAAEKLSAQDIASKIQETLSQDIKNNLGL